MKAREKSNSDLVSEGENSEASGLETLKSSHRYQSKTILYVKTLFSTVLSQAAGLNVNDLTNISEDGRGGSKRYFKIL